MAFAYLRSRQHLGIGAEADSPFYDQWSLSRELFPRMNLRSAWDSREFLENDVRVPVAQSGMVDDDKTGFISDLDYSPSGRLLAASSSSNHLFVLDPNRGSIIKTFNKPHKDAISKVRFVDEYQFVSGSADTTIGYWDLRSPTKALNFLQGHKRNIRSLHYYPSNDTLVTSCRDGDIRYWHLPSFVVNSENTDEEEDPFTQQVLLKCPNLNQCYFSELHNMALFSNHSGTIFIIHNLSVPHLKEDLGHFVFDDTLQMQLCWIKPNSSPDKRNRLVVVDNSEYSPLADATISNMAHLSLHPTLPISLMRITTARVTNFSREVKEWTCVYNLKEQSLTAPNITNELDRYMQMYGSNVLEGMLLFTIEESRYASLQEKQPGFSLCGRIIASPDVQGIRLLKFSQNMGTCTSPIKNISSLDSLLYSNEWSTYPSALEVATRIPAPEKSVLCCKFSPNDNTLLAVGDAEGQIRFCNPKL